MGTTDALNIGVFAVDPGGATGLAWAILNPKADVGDALRGKMNAGSATVEGDIRGQVREIVGWWMAFYRQCVDDALLPVENIWFVCEDFIYSSENTYGGESAMISTALIWGVEGYRMGQRDAWLAGRGKRKAEMPDMILQTAGIAKGHATRARLKEWDCWVVGRDHERSAYQHLAYFLSKYKQQYG